MAELYTNVDDVFLCNGRKTRVEAIEEAREHWRYQLKIAETFLARRDDEITVTIVRGCIVQHHVEELKP